MDFFRDCGRLLFDDASVGPLKIKRWTIRPLPVRLEIESPAEFPLIARLHTEIVAHIRYPAIVSFGVLPDFSCNDNAIIRVCESISDQERISANGFYLDVGEIRRIPLIDDPLHKGNISLFIENEVHLTRLGPVRKFVLSARNFLLNLEAELGVTFFCLIAKPVPILINAPELIILILGRD